MAAMVTPRDAVNASNAWPKLSVFDLSAAALAALAAAGARAAESAQDAVRDADIVISMLPASGHVRELYLGAGTLERAHAVLGKMGKNIFHAGGAGAGQVAKVCNNMLLGILMAGTAEALNLGVAHGLDPAVLSDIMSKSSGRNWALEVYNPWPGVMPAAPASRDYSGGFGTALMLKDLVLAEQAAQAVHAATPLGRLARQLYQLHQQQGSGPRDFSSIVELVKQGVAGLPD